MISLAKKIMALPLIAHIGATLTAMAYFHWIKGRLDGLYAASRHPVDYATGQTTFNGAQIKEYYAVMQGEGTLELYVQTQIVDFGFMIGVVLLGLAFGSFAARLGGNFSWARNTGLAVVFFAAAGAGFDAIENLISFWMLNNPQGFADWIAIPYSEVVPFSWTGLRLS